MRFSTMLWHAVTMKQRVIGQCWSAEFTENLEIIAGLDGLCYTQKENKGSR